MAPWADVLYACDPEWWAWHYKYVMQGFEGEKFALLPEAENRRNGFKRLEGVEFILSRPLVGLSEDKNIIHEGMNSGYQAINLAYHRGAKTILLLGYDMQATGGKHHWFGDHPNNRHPTYDTLVKVYNDFATKHLPKYNLRIINCTRITALNCFEKMSLESALSSVQDQV